MATDQSATIQHLIGQFTNAARSHHTAQMAGDSKKANSQAKKLHKAFMEIVKIGPEARDALLELADDTDQVIALVAATYSLKHNPKRSLSALEKLKKSPGIIGFKAEQALKRWEEGTWDLE